MKRVMVIGCCGSGKSTLATALHEITGLNLIHLDQHYWKPNWTESSKEEWELKVAELAAGERWIIDGNYGGTFQLREARADTIIFMDFSTLTCLSRVIKRVWKYHRKVRPDMPEGCKERFDLDFLHYVAVYNLTRRKSILKRLEFLKETKRIEILKNDSDIKMFLGKISDEIVFKKKDK